MSAVIESHGHDDHHHGPAKGLTRWLYTTNHKDIGTLYLWFSFAMFLIGGAMAMIIRAELFQPGMQIVEPEFYNQMITLHGLIMIFGGVMPAFGEQLGDVDIASIVTYTRNAWGNNTGDIIQPKEVAEARQTPNIITAGVKKRENTAESKPSEDSLKKSIGDLAEVR